MRSYIIRRVLLLIPTFFLVTILVFLSVRFIPGDAVDLLMHTMMESSGGASSIDRAELERRLGLDVPGVRAIRPLDRWDTAARRSRQAAAAGQTGWRADHRPAAKPPSSSVWCRSSWVC